MSTSPTRGGTLGATARFSPARGGARGGAAASGAGADAADGGDGDGATATASAFAAIRLDPEFRDLFAQRAELRAKRLELLRAQKLAADQLNELLDGKEGLSYHAERSRRNVMAAIVVARQMGYFRYYRTPPETVRLEAVVPTRVRTIRAVQAEMDELDAKLAQLDADEAALKARPPPPVNTLVAWFAANGRPEGLLGSSYRLTIKAGTRRMGATKHYPAFQTVSSRLVLGRALR